MLNKTDINMFETPIIKTKDNAKAINRVFHITKI